MEEKSKSILGLKAEKDERRRKRYFTDSDKHFIIQEVLRTGKTKREIWEKHTGDEHDHGQILRWMRQLGYDESVSIIKTKNVLNLPLMKKQEEPDNRNELLDNIQLKKRIEELEKQLQESEMKAIAFSTMVDVAEQEFKISIRKKYNTKP